MSIEKISVYILSRDRLQYFKEALSSVLEACSNVAKVIVSDNSENNDISNYMSEMYPTVKFISRRPTLTAEQHFKAIISEADSEFLVMFHDDDIMLPDFVTTLYSKLVIDETLAAVGSNAKILSGDSLKENSFYQGKADKLFYEPSDLARQYFCYTSDGVAPFPGYMYRTKFIDHRDFDFSLAGKYTDVLLLIGLLERGKILWTSDAFMHYRFHDQNDSNDLSMSSYLMLFRRLYAKHGMRYLRNQFRFNLWWDNYRKNGSFSRFPGLIKRFMIWYFFKAIFISSDFWKKLALRLR